MERFFKKNKQQPADRGRKIILDTNGLIDGRIIDVAKAGFIPDNIIIPQFVIAELQFLADKADSQKRERARYGLDVIRELQDLRGVTVTIAREKFPNIKEVDDKLVALAKQYRSPLYTIDYNLNKVAQIEGVTVLNVNELAQALRPSNLPGEKATVKLVQPGQDPNQAVGYLDDGTMVVVEQARKLIGQKVNITFTRMLQTQAGKMSFATMDKQKNGSTAKQPARPAQGERSQSDSGNKQQAGDKQSRPQQKSGRQSTRQAQDKQPEARSSKQSAQNGQSQNRQQKGRRGGRRDNPEDKLMSLIDRTQ
jgi:rRNA-processing protein FCF1